MVVEENSLLDSFNLNGNSFESLSKFCNKMDEITEIIDIDYSQFVEVLTYQKTKNGKASFFNCSSVKLNESEDKVLFVNDESTEVELIKTENGKIKRNKGLISLINEIKLKKAKNEKFGTVYKYTDDDNKVIYMFPGTTSFFTFKLFPIPYTKSCIERDLLLAKELLEVKDDVELLTVLRKDKQGDCAKVVAWFSNRGNDEDSKILPFKTIADAVRESKASVIKWEATQICTKVIIQYEDEVNKFKNKYNLPFKPVIVLTFSDSGRVSNNVKSAWMALDESNYFESKPIKVKTSYIEAISKAMVNHEAEAEKMIIDSKKEISKDDSIEEIFDVIIKSSPAINEIGIKKSLRKLQDYVSEKFKASDSPSILDIKGATLLFANENELSANIKEKFPRIAGGIILE